jgi:hypothetical protein
MQTAEDLNLKNGMNGDDDGLSQLFSSCRNPENDPFENVLRDLLFFVSGLLSTLGLARWTLSIDN